MTTSNILFIDTQVKDYETLVASLPADTQWFLIDSDSDAISQMLAVLESFSDLASIQIVSHGSEGSLLLGGSLLDAAALQGYREQLAQLGSYLSEDGDLLLYGCDVAAGETGAAFIELLASLTGADVAASTDTTGLGGDWVLEASTGSIEAQALEAAAYTASLDVITGTEGPETLYGTAGDDTINTLGGNDRIVDTGGSNYADGGDGYDIIHVLVTSGDQTLVGGLDDDTIIGMGQTVSILGGEGNDFLRATGYEKNDSITGENDTKSVDMLAASIYGGAGNDIISGSFLGSALIEAGDGNDSVELNASYQASISGGLGADAISVSFNTDQNSLVGAEYDNRYHIDGGDDADTITLSGDAPGTSGLVSATLLGGAGADSLTVTEASTQSNAGSGGILAVELDGGDGNDTLSASGVIALTMTGGSGSDKFVLTSQQYEVLAAGQRILISDSALNELEVQPEPTLITDFTAGTGGDVLDISELLNLSDWNTADNPFVAGYIQLVDAGTDVLVLFDPDGHAGFASSALTVAILQNVQLADLTDANFEPALTPSGTVIPGTTLTGDAASNTLIGGLGNDTIIGLAGNDSLNGEIGDDSIEGGLGDDTLTGGYGNDSLYGGDGADLLFDSYGSNLIDGGAGNDELISQTLGGTQSLYGGSGLDTITGTAQNLYINTGADADREDAYAEGRLSVNGTDRYVQNGHATIVSEGSDRDYLYGNYWASLQVDTNDSGSYVNLTHNANVTVNGGSGNERVIVDIDGSKSTLLGESLGTTLNISTGGGNDRIEVSGYAGLDAGLATMTLDGGAGNDTFIITEESSAITGVKSGGIASAQISGGDGDDSFDVSGVLQLTLTGGNGSDTFKITAHQYATLMRGDRTFTTSSEPALVSAEPVTITDFTPGAGGDILDLLDLLTTEASGWVDSTSPFAGGYLVLTTDGADTLVQFDADGNGDNWVTIARLSNVAKDEVLSSNLLPAWAPTSNVTNVQGEVTISGTLEQGQILTAVTSELADADGLGSFSYQWYANNSPIEGATGPTYELTQSEVDQLISVKVSYTDGAGNNEAKTSTQTAAIANVNDLPSGNVLITDEGGQPLAGAPVEGQILVVNTDNITDLDGLGAFSYQWYADGAPIAGATGSSLTLTQAQVGLAISVNISYTDGQGTLENQSSTQTAPVANINNLPGGEVTILGENTLGSTLTASQNITDLDGLGNGFSYQWQADGANISGATGSSYTLTLAEVGKSITLVISYTDGYGNLESVASAPTEPVTKVNDAPQGSVSISGTAAQGETLTASNDLSDVDGMGAISYQWYADGTVITGATGSTYTLTQDEVGKIITVTASYQDNGGTDEAVSSAATSPVANINDAPAGSLTLTGNATQRETLQVVNNITDADGVIVSSISYQWYADGVAIPDANGTSLFLGQGLVGKQIKVIASYTDGYGNIESFSSPQTAAILDVNDAPFGGVYINGSQAEGQTLTASNDLSDPDGLGDFSYQWYLDGTEINGATSDSLLVNSPELASGHISVTISYVDGAGSSESISSDDEPRIGENNSAPTGGLTIEGSPTEDATLTVISDIDDADGFGSDISYQWFANGKAIEGATGSSLLLTQEHVGQTISVHASYFDGLGKLETVSSAPTVAIINVEDPLTGDLSISGALAQGRVVSADISALIDEDGIDSIAYQWFVNDEPVSGATAASLTLDQSMTGANIRVEATVTDGGGTVYTISSASAGPVANANDLPQGELQITGSPIEGQTLSADYSGISDADGMPEDSASYQFQWLRNGTIIDGATAASYTLTSADADQQISVRISYTDGLGAVETLTSAETTVYSLAGGQLVLTENDDIFDALSGYDWVLGLGGNDSINGLAGNDTLEGGEGNDTLDGGTGDDSLIGGAGDDVYYVDSVLDIVEEAAGMGNDTVYSAINYSAAANTEVVWLVGENASNAVGNELANTLHGNDLNNRLNGGAGVDTMYGGLGDDIYYADEYADSAVEQAGEGYDQVNSTVTYVLGQNLEALLLQGNKSINGYGNDLNNKLYGNAANNRLDGRAGVDIMYGGAGNDIYYVDESMDRTVELSNNGYDLVYATATHALNRNVETLVLKGNDALRGYGNELNNRLYGNNADNVLNGKAGADWMYGDGGDDLYFVDNSNDRAVEYANEGTDYVISTVTFALGNHVEVLTLRGNADIKGYGSAQDNKIYGNNGDNVINGMAGADAMYGAAGDDIYFVDNVRDRVIESVNQGNDIINTTVTYTLSSNVEILVLKGSGMINGYGNGLANKLYGNAASNILDGDAGNDIIVASGGNDTLIGGLGRDVLTGGAGRDLFTFNSLADSGVAASNRDVITDFTSGSDKIDLSAIDANTSLGGNQAFTLLASGESFSAAGQLMLVNGVLYGNTDADSTAEFSIALSGVKALTSSDFIL